jgi:DNA polymerase I-like protein with 3'-5' exonuclease and polymerase domains
MNNTCVFDIETNGLDENLTKVHCMVLFDMESEQYFKYGPNMGNLQIGLNRLDSYSTIVGHNIIRFDIPAMTKILGWKPKVSQEILDTLVLSRLVFPDRKSKDFEKKKVSSDQMGRHTLKSWGQRLGFEKGLFLRSKEVGQSDFSDFGSYSDNMLEYCRRDVQLTVMLFNHLRKANFSKESIKLEHEIFKICNKQEEDGFPFDAIKASQFYAVLCEHRKLLQTELKNKFGSWMEPSGEVFTPKVNNKKLGYKKGIPFQRLKLIEFNPNSRQHISKRLTAIHGWQPKEVTPTGEPKIDEGVLEKLKYPEAKLMAEALRINKMIGQLSEGKYGWLSLEKENRLHGAVHTMGTIASRCSHTHPNLGQVPSVKTPFGKECRQLFTAPKGFDLMGCDVSGLEARVLAHYLARFDNGVFSNTLLKGDIHSSNQKALGLSSRDQAKTFLYALCYGAGNVKLGQIVGKGVQEGQRLKDRFFKSMPAFKKLRDAVALRGETGYLTGLDGRMVPVRSEHSSLNTLCQSAGAIICKRWVVVFHDLLRARGFVEDKDYQQVAFVHDEIQVLVKEGKGDEIGKIAVEAIEQAGKEYNLRLPLTGEYKLGKSWAETH